MKARIASLKARLRSGITPAMATPLAPGGYELKESAIPPLVEFLLSTGVSGLFVGGTTGEGILLDTATRQRLHELTLSAANGRAPVILHCGANRTDTAVKLASHAAELGAVAIAAVTPTFYGMHDQALADYYHAVAAAAPDTPLLLYDIPHMAVNGISPSLLCRLAEEIPTLAGVKTSQSNAQLLRELVDMTPSNLMVLVGNERILLGSLALGAHGVISGLSTAVPEPFVALTRAFAAGALAEAQQQQQLINRILNKMPDGVRIGGIKSILHDRGIDVGPAVPPRPMPTTRVWAAMQPILEASA